MANPFPERTPLPPQEGRGSEQKAQRAFCRRGGFYNPIIIVPPVSLYKTPACVCGSFARCARIPKHIAPLGGESWKLASTARGASCGVTAPSHACKQAREPLALLLHASASAG